MSKRNSPSTRGIPSKIDTVRLKPNLIQIGGTVFLMIFLMSGCCSVKDEIKDVGSSGFPESLKSPNGKWTASIRRIPDRDLFWSSGYDDTQLAVFDITNPGYRRRTAEHLIAGRLVDDIQWSPDSRFLVFTTSYTSGSSPWHYHPFLFCMDDKTVRDIDHDFGTVISSKIEFEDPDVLILGIVDYSTGDDAEEHPKKVKIPLGKTFKTIPKDESCPMGGVSPNGRFYATTGDGSNESSGGNAGESSDFIWPPQTDHRPKPDFASTVSIFSQKGKDDRKLISKYKFPSRIDRLDWSPDSRFLVFTTALPTASDKASLYKVLVFGVDDKTLRRMDKVVGQVTSSWFQFEAPDIITLKIKDTKAKNPRNSRAITISLGKTFTQMPEESVKP